MDSPDTDWLPDELEEEEDSVSDDVPENRSLQVQALPDENKKDALARTALRPNVQASMTIAQMSGGAFADVGLTELTNALEKYELKSILVFQKFHQAAT